MTVAEDRVAVLLMLMHQLQDVMRTENGLLREMRLPRLQELQQEKSALADAYELALRRLRQAPETMGSLDEASRGMLEAAMREFQLAVRGNAERLLQSRGVIEDIVRILGESLNRGTATGGYGGSAAKPVSDATTARVIPMTLDRRC